MSELGGAPAWAVKGAKCICVDDSDWEGRYLNGDPVDLAAEGIVTPEKGRIYTIRDVIALAASSLRVAAVGVRLVEVDNGHLAHRSVDRTELCFWVGRFRPLITRTKEQDMAIFAPLLGTRQPELERT
jgi:hypothetical protein